MRAPTYILRALGADVGCAGESSGLSDDTCQARFLPRLTAEPTAEPDQKAADRLANAEALTNENAVLAYPLCVLEQLIPAEFGCFLEFVEHDCLPSDFINPVGAQDVAVPGKSSGFPDRSHQTRLLSWLAADSRAKPDKQVPDRLADREAGVALASIQNRFAADPEALCVAQLVLIEGPLDLTERIWVQHVFPPVDPETFRPLRPVSTLGGEPCPAIVENQYSVGLVHAT
jgi:hypothetical protein